MSYDHIDLKLEVEIFEALEIKTNLTLGEINQLRRLSRQKNKNLLFLAYDQQHIDTHSAQEIARQLEIDSHKAPWMNHYPSRQRNQGYITLNQRRENYGKQHQKQGNASQGHTSQGHTSQGHTSQGHTSQGHTAQGHNTAQGHTSQGHTSQGYTAQGHTSQVYTPQGHTSQEQTPTNYSPFSSTPNLRPKRKKHQNVHAKTEIEINIPKTIEEREWLQVTGHLSSHSEATKEEAYPHQSEIKQQNNPNYMPQASTMLPSEIVLGSISEVDTTPPPLLNPPLHLSDPSHREESHTKDRLNTNHLTTNKDTLTTKDTTSPTSSTNRREQQNTQVVLDEENTPPHGFFLSQPGQHSTNHIVHEVSLDNRWQVQPYPISKWGKVSASDQIECFMLWEAFDTVTQKTIHLLTVHDQSNSTSAYALLSQLPLAYGIPQLMWAHVQDESLVQSLSYKPQHIYAFKAFKGRKLKQLLIEDHLSSWERRAMILWQITYVMYHTHQRKIIHGNLSTAGIWHAEGRIQIGYWEKARSHHTIPSHSDVHDIFEPEYTAPEVLAGEHPVFQSDVYSLGAIAFYLLTGKAPPQETYLQEQMLEKNPYVNQRWMDLCLRSLSSQIQTRPKDACEFYTQLFQQKPTSLQSHDSEHATLELDFNFNNIDLYLSQILFDAGLSLSTLSLLKKQKLLSTKDEKPYFPLMPRASIKVISFDPSQAIHIRELKQKHHQAQLIENEKSFYSAGTYHLTWTQNGVVQHWMMTLEPLMHTTFQPFSLGNSDWKHIPAGKSYVGSNHTEVDELLLHAIQLDSFEISTRLVSIQEYQDFIQHQMAQGGNRSYTSWQDHHPSHHPILGLELEDMQAYCQWKGDVRLPLEAEWERCIRGASHIEFISDSILHILQDFNPSWAEICINRHQRAVLKGGIYNRGYIGKSQPLEAYPQARDVVFRVVKC